MDRVMSKPFGEWDVLIKGLLEIARTLERDVNKFVERLNEEPHDETWKRAIVRTLVSSIEAMLYGLKQITVFINQSVITEIKLNSKEEKELAINRDNMIENFKIIFKYFPKFLGFEYKMDFDKDPGWQKYCIAKNIRDRLTHPKKRDDLRVTERDYTDVALASQWFEKQEKIVFEEYDKWRLRIQKKNQRLIN